MSNWIVEYHPKAVEDIKKLDGAVRPKVLKVITKVSQNPLPTSEGGYGKPLGNRAGNNLSCFLKIKLKASGIRIVYQLVREKNRMRVIIVGVREESKVYIEGVKRISEEAKPQKKD